MARTNGTRESTLTSSTLRLSLFLVYALQWACGVVSLGLTVHFISNWDRGLNATYGVVIGAVNTWAYAVAMILPHVKQYKGWLFPVNVAFSHLWLTYFIFNALAYSHQDCVSGTPVGLHQCSKKYTLEAFSFLTFFFTLVATFLDPLLYLHEKYLHEPAVTRAPLQEEEEAKNVSSGTDGIAAESSGANAV